MEFIVLVNSLNENTHWPGKTLHITTTALKETVKNCRRMCSLIIILIDNCYLNPLTF